MMQFDLRGETVVVTGGAVRLGRAIALELARAGANVAITWHTSGEKARQTLQELRALGDEKQRFEAYQLEVSDAAQIEALARDVETDLGGATALVNNAAIFRRTPFETLNESDFDAHINANLKGPFLLCRTFGAAFVKRGGGAIVNIADIHSLRPLKNYVPYCVSKAGLVMLTQTLALALAPKVRVNAVCPGTILLPSQSQGEASQGEASQGEASQGDDDAAEHLLPKIPLQRLGDDSDIAQSVAFLLASPYISGALLPVDGAQRLK